MAVVQHSDDAPSSPQEQHNSKHVNTYNADPRSGIMPASGGGPVRFPRRDQSLNARETGHPAPRDWNPKHMQDRSPALPPPSPSYPFPAHPARRHNTGGGAYDHRYYQSPNPPAAPTYARSNSSRDPRSHNGYLRDGPSPSQAITSSSISPRWDPKTYGAAYRQAATSAPNSPIGLDFMNGSSYSAGEAHRSINSVASETRDEFPALPSNRLNVADNHGAVENFSRPRVPSIKQSYHDTAQLRSPTQPRPDQSLHDPGNAHGGSWSRSRDPSISSNQSASTFASLAVRPSYDSQNRDNPRGRARQPHPPPTRPPLFYMRAESSGPAFSRDPMPRMASLPGDELRSSFRSQLSGSTAQGTHVTERSSIQTKSSSVTSMYGNIDDSLSVDDVLGLYDKGFDDDSAAEDNDPDESPPPTAFSESSQGGTTELDIVAEMPAMISGRLSVSASGGPIVRDSAAIFRVSNHKPTSSENSAKSKEISDVSQETQSSPRDDFTPSPPVRHETTMTTTGEDERDRYGFKKSNQYITTEEFDRWDNDYSKYLARRRRKWNLLLKENGLMTDSPNRFPPRSAKTKRFVRKGIPPDWRGAAWFYYAGGPAIVAKHAGLYDELLDRQVKDVDAEAIERDLHRTFPDNIRFRSAAAPHAPIPDEASRRNSQQTMTGSAKNAAVPGEAAMISALRRVLYAFSIYNPRIGYCQSLNFLAGLLLLFVESEEQAFWLLNIITRVYLPGTHEMSLEGANVDLGVLMSSIRDTMPNIWAKIGGELDGTEVARPKSRRHRQRVELTTRLPPITLCMTAWFMSCFIGTLPIESTLRVWDIFFYEGSKTLFRIALTIFKLGEPEIKLVGDPMEIFQVVQTIPRKIIDANGLMEACYKRRNGFGHLSQETIEQKRQERRNHVKAEKERLASGEPLVSVDTDVGRKGTLFKRKAKG
ncbi:putative GTPase activating protein [Rosellinia necatrix]|uniref:Putative GTPase activating protein n=1 Tax=Rosellinia necatrix TaxID=77044 RepID=A0A1S7UI28_ROSNE|nr:putative GTPase activating protein [Rosellinia necatrix]